MIGLDPTRRARQSRRWRNAFFAAVVACVSAYAAGLASGGVSPGNVWGLTFGTAAMILMIAVGAWGLRRRTMKAASSAGLGASRTWILFHLYAGTVFVLVTGMHMAFRLPVGAVTRWLFWLSIVTVLSGYAGLLLQRWIPKALTSGTSLEVLYERVPELVGELRDRAQKIAAACDEPLVVAFFEDEVQPELAAPRRRIRFLVDPSGGARARLRAVDYLRNRVPSSARPALEELASILKAKLAIDAHFTLQWLLRYWLVTHLPVSLMSYAFLALHLYAVYAW